MRNVAPLLLVTLLLACGGPGDPVGRLSVAEHEVALPHGRLVPLELRWEAKAALEDGEGAPIAFVHLLDAEGSVARTFDHPLPGRWEPGKTIVDRLELVQSALAPPLPAGEYRLTVGLYDGERKRWPLLTDGEEVARQEYVVAKVRVSEGSRGRYSFSEAWLPVEATVDRQTVARRWLSGDGWLEVKNLPRPAELALRLHIPRNEPPLRLVLEAGASQPAVSVVSGCSGFTATVSGSGTHDVRVPVPPPGDCRVRLDANFTVLEPGTQRKLSTSLELLAWQPLPAGKAVPVRPAADATATATPPATP